jgi:hypothetical protein
MLKFLFASGMLLWSCLSMQAQQGPGGGWQPPGWSPPVNQMSPPPERPPRELPGRQVDTTRDLNPTRDPDVQRGIDNYRRPQPR